MNELGMMTSTSGIRFEVWYISFEHIGDAHIQIIN